MPTKILSTTILLNEVSMATTGTFPTIPAGSNRIVEVIISAYNGAGNAGPITAITSAGKSGVFICGDTTAQDKTSLAVYHFREADISAISGASFTTTIGAGSQKCVSVTVYSDCSQVMPVNTNAGRVTSGMITLPLTRSNNSLTIGYAFLSVTGTVLSFNNPTQMGSITYTNRRVTYTQTADTARIADFTSTSASTATTALVYNLKAFPLGSIGDVNDGTNIVRLNSTANRVVVNNIVPTSGSIGSKALTNFQLLSGNIYTFDVADAIDNETIPELDVSQTLSVTNGDETPIKTITFSSPTNFNSTAIGTPIMDNDKFIGIGLNTLGYAITSTDRIVYNTAMGTISSNGKISANNSGSFNGYLWVKATSKIYNFTLNVTADVNLIPDNVILPNAVNKPLATYIYSKPFTISGVDVGNNLPLTITGGEYRLNSGAGYGDYGTANTTVKNTDILQVRLLSDNNVSTVTNLTLKVGLREFTFQTNTAALGLIDLSDWTKNTITAPAFDADFIDGGH